MKWVATLALSSIALLAMNPAASAGDYHSGLNLRCSECHIMHYSQQHGYQPGGGGFFLAPLAGGPHHYLLRGPINDLCLACHDGGGFAPDVLGSAGAAGVVRSAGYLNRLAGEGLDATGHTLDSTDAAPGSAPSWTSPDPNGLNCIDCHHQHGRGGYYRNLQGGVGNEAYPNTPVTYAIGTNVLTEAVFERFPATYDEGAVDWNEPGNAGSAIATWCGGCHTNFHGAPGGSEVGGVASGSSYVEFLRHPSADVEIGGNGGGHSNLGLYTAAATAGNAVKVMSASGDWSGATPDVTPTCISCHKSHGNGNAFGLLYRKGGATGGTITEEGSTGGSQLEHLCGQCHVQAGAFNI